MVCAEAHAGPPAPPLPPLSARRGCPCPCDTPPKSLPPAPPPQTALASARAPPATDRQKQANVGDGALHTVIVQWLPGLRGGGVVPHRRASTQRGAAAAP